MLSRLVFLSLSAAVLVQPSLALGQDGDQTRDEGPVGRDASPLVQQFLATAPSVGEALPDVTVYDDQGNPVNLRELTRRGHYTALTLGCLT